LLHRAPLRAAAAVGIERAGVDMGFAAPTTEIESHGQAGTMQGDDDRKEMPLWTIVALAIVIGWAIAEVILYFFNR
jgi:hypothetical protein